jgi:hypothetical protein
MWSRKQEDALARGGPCADRDDTITENLSAALKVTLSLSRFNRA